MRVFTTLPQENLATVGQAAQAIEATGYTGVSTQENRHEPFLSWPWPAPRPSASSCTPVLPSPSRVAHGGGQCRLGPGARASAASR